MATPSTQAAADPESDVLRQCQNCFKEQTEDRKLLTCSRCKRSHYCSKDCQTAHWPSHKENCTLTADLRSDIRATSAALRAEGLGAPDPQEIERLLKQFSQTRRPILTMAALEAFRLDVRPQDVSKYVLWVELAPTGRPYPHEFRLLRAEKWTLDDLRANYATPSLPSLLERIESLHQQSQEIAKKGGLGVAIAIVSCGPVKHMMPLGISDHPRDAGLKFENTDLWLEKLKMGIERTF
ncbi:zinc finger MYND domain-containing protein [Phanerochaete sordida]|uniref:Zinc finger MYND domain-containing protein n=1 Tax=Phanerochaete sordida TaxID=48140 RepID=A0A9P3GAJ5_9APHY|nr:zinc finger MYND domain-containing protein [Phanerochaete sordida]